MPRPHRSALASLAALASACAAPSEAPATPPPVPPEAVAPALFEVHRGDADREVAAAVLGHLGHGRRLVEDFFARPFAEPVRVDVLPDRAAFTAWFPPEWGLGETACWIVASGVADRLAVLSPRVWPSEACEHDPGDPRHVRDLLVHELVHVYHGQHNPTRDFTGAESVGWFAEGLATYVSGQLERGHRERAREAARRGAVPASLETSWSGPYRYGVCGTLVELLDRECGRETLFAMLAVTQTSELLALAGMTEADLLAVWTESTRGGRATGR